MTDPIEDLVRGVVRHFQETVDRRYWRRVYYGTWRWSGGKARQPAAYLTHRLWPQELMVTLVDDHLRIFGLCRLPGIQDIQICSDRVDPAKPDELDLLTRLVNKLGEFATAFGGASVEGGARP